MSAPEVRILAGRWKGRRLDANRSARPTSSRARSALFDVLGESVSGADVLDLFAGSGAVGIEAVSRGARSAVLVEPDAALVEAAVERLGAAPSELRVLGEGALPAVRRLSRERVRFDLVFADPPYDVPLDPDLLNAIGDLLRPGGAFVLQRDERDPDPGIPGLRLSERRAYGRNVFFFFGMR